MTISRVPGESVTLRSTTRQTVEFFDRHAGDPAIAAVAAKILDTIVECMTVQCRGETSAVVELLHGMERRLHASVESIGGQVQQHVMSLIVAVEHAVRASVEKLNVGDIATTVSSAIRGWLQDEIDVLKGGHVASAVGVRDLETRVRDVVTHMVSVPQSARHEHLVGMLTGLPAQVSMACARATTEDRLPDRLAEMRTRLDDALATQARDVLDTRAAVALLTERVQQVVDSVQRSWADAKERSVEQRASASQSMDQVPAMVRSVLNEALRDLEAKSRHVETLVQGTQQQLLKIERDVCDSLGSLQVLRKGSDDVTARVDSLGHQLTVRQSSTRDKGQQGESRLLDLLTERLTARQNYSIDIVSGIAHACDMNIRRLGYPDVRVESKAHGEQTGEKVRAKETVRFQSDLLAMNSHGIFVSIFSEIAGKGKIEFQVLSNNKLAVYLSNNNYDVDIINDVLQLIYRVDQITRDGGAAEAAGMIKVTPESMMRVQLYLKDFAVKVQTTKTHMKEAMSLLNDLTFDLIESVLLGHPAPKQTAVIRGGR